VQLIANTVGINIGFVMTILGANNYVDDSLREMVPRMFDQKLNDYQWEESSENLKLMQLEWNLFVRCTVIGDETCTVKIGYIIIGPMLNSKLCTSPQVQGASIS